MFFFFLLLGKSEIEKEELLSRHDVVAKFSHIQHIPCRFRTSLCPDHCDHATDVAVFDVIKYINYEKHGEYGDEKQEQIFVDVKKEIYKQDASIAALAKTLKKGQKVKLVYDHIYLTKDNGSYPVRPCTKLEVIEN